MSDWDPMLLNLSYAAMGGLLMLVFTWIGGRVFSNIMGFKLRDELKAGNVAVGLAVLGLLLGTSVGMGLVIGLALN